ncbi:MAG TPA: endonuclease III [Actinomycetota bacterium]|nr:endonuclease III [Actinomycetota bacterium]
MRSVPVTPKQARKGTSRTQSDTPRRPLSGRPPSPPTVREIYRRLAREFGPLDPPRRLDPLEELIITVLSQNTSDVNRDRAYSAMRARFPTWEALAQANPTDLATSIRPGGLANIKAPRLLAILREIEDREGGALDLSWMGRASSARVRDYLVTLPGVGPKTAACVLAFSLGRPALPVDTHVHRVARRLGFFDDRTDAATAHQVMEELVPPRLRVRMHVGMIRLGRTICRAGRPSCAICPLQELCPTAPSILGSGTRARASRPR